MLLTRPETRLDIKDNTGWTPLHFACWRNSVEVVCLYCRDARCGVPQTCSIRRLMLVMAMTAGSLASVRELARSEGLSGRWQSLASLCLAMMICGPLFVWGIQIKCDCCCPIRRQDWTSLKSVLAGLLYTTHVTGTVLK